MIVNKLEEQIIFHAKKIKNKLSIRYNGARVNSTPQPEGIYNGSASIRSSSGGSGIYYHNRPYPYPHQRYRDPVIPSTTAASIASNSTLREESETPGQDWMGAYGQYSNIIVQ